MTQVIIAPSILAADFARLGEEVEAVARAGADWIHIDIMDGHFVPNISFGADVMRAVRGRTEKPFDVHLMCAPVDPWLEPFAKAGAQRLTVHAEAGPHLDRTLQAIAALGCKAGVALCPSTPLEAIEYVLGRVDLVLVMTVNPGYGGQKFLPATMPKLERLRAMTAGRGIHLQVDGGIDPTTAPVAIAAGATALVAGTSVFKKPDYAQAIAALRPVMQA